mmetsp:Transcript_46697/g.144008  ORF Transcript_46697/g.144008 Transcript_46697/m.144008 type:complete len:280 (-) Transcript_46697:954-1793(-)
MLAKRQCRRDLRKSNWRQFFVYSRVTESPTSSRNTRLDSGTDKHDPAGPWGASKKTYRHDVGAHRKSVLYAAASVSQLALPKQNGLLRSAHDFAPPAKRTHRPTVWLAAEQNGGTGVAAVAAEGRAAIAGRLMALAGSTTTRIGDPKTWRCSSHLVLYLNDLRPLSTARMPMTPRDRGFAGSSLVPKECTTFTSNANTPGSVASKDTRRCPRRLLSEERTCSTVAAMKPLAPTSRAVTSTSENAAQSASLSGLKLLPAPEPHVPQSSMRTSATVSPTRA